MPADNSQGQGEQRKDKEPFKTNHQLKSCCLIIQGLQIQLASANTFVENEVHT